MTTQVHRWLETARRSCDMQVTEIRRSRSKEWSFDGRRLSHSSGGFFSVVGAALYAGGQRQPRLDQPLIDQPEIGLLGFLIRTVRDTRQILVQAKPEPGNIAMVQAAPSVQATESNYTQRHKGKTTPFLDCFLAPVNGSSVLSDCLQSEQGTRFLGKYNRNMVVNVAAKEPLREAPAHQWFPIQDLHSLLLEDFQVNTDARSVLASAPWRVLTPEGTPFSRWRGHGGPGEAFLRSFEAPETGSVLSTTRIIQRLHSLRATADFTATLVDLRDLAAWEITDTAITTPGRDAFAVRHFAVETSEREVPSWDQPLIASPQEGQAVLLCQERAGVLHFLFDARPEIGFREKFQYGPTIQDLGDEPSILPSREAQASALRHVMTRSHTLLSSRHSDEGGRFFRCVTRYAICLLQPGDTVELEANLSWMTLRQVQRLVRRPGFFSNEARSLISMVLAFL